MNKIFECEQPILPLKEPDAYDYHLDSRMTVEESGEGLEITVGCHIEEIGFITLTPRQSYELYLSLLKWVNEKNSNEVVNNES